MPVDIYDLEFQNWLKGVLALNTTREALCRFVSETLGSWITKFSEEQRAHIKQFLICLNRNGVQQLKQRNKSRRKDNKYSCVCEHELCKILFNMFLQEHSDSATLSHKWEYIQKTTKETHPSELKETELIWRIAVLYMFVEAGGNTEEYHSFDDLDISQVIRMMRSCRLCVPDGSLEYYDEVLGFRNCLMHSPNNNVTDEYLQEKLKKTKTLLETLGAISDYGEELEYLQKLGENKFTIMYQSKEYQHIVSEVIKADHIAVDLVNSIDDSKNELKSHSKHLQDCLEDIFTTGLEVLNSQFTNSKLACKPSDLKSLVKSCIETKKRSLELDKQQFMRTSDEGDVNEEQKVQEVNCQKDIHVNGTSDEGNVNMEELEQLQEQTENDLKDINEQLKATDEEHVADLIDQLNKEISILKEEQVRKEKQVKENFKMIEAFRNEIQTLKSENNSLQSKIGEPDVPAHWDDMGSENLRVVALKQDSNEYQTVKQKFEDSMNPPNNDRTNSFNVTKIERVQNKTLWQQYHVKKRQLETQNPKGIVNERELWHGTGAYAVESINLHGLNRSYAGKNSTVYGDGVYFCVTAKYASRRTYSTPDTSGQQRVYLFLVLTGEYAKGQQGMRVPPQKPSGGPTSLYDSVTDNINNPALFVIFNDTQAFPQYIVYFRESA